jgi:hypothetical protein
MVEYIERHGLDGATVHGVFTTPVMMAVMACGNPLGVLNLGCGGVRRSRPSDHRRGQSSCAAPAVAGPGSAGERAHAMALVLVPEAVEQTVLGASSLLIPPTQAASRGCLPRAHYPRRRLQQRLARTYEPVSGRSVPLSWFTVVLQPRGQDSTALEISPTCVLCATASPQRSSAATSDSALRRAAADRPVRERACKRWELCDDAKAESLVQRIASR